MSEGETKSMSAVPDEDGTLRLVIETTPETPLDQLPPRMRLGTMIRRGRIRREKSLREVAEIVGLSEVVLGQIERGIVPVKADHLQQIASVTGCDWEALLQAAREFHVETWSTTGGKEGVVAVSVAGDARVSLPPFGPVPSEHVMPPEQLFVEYREGWFAGASGRDNPLDMSPEWERGHEDGRVSMEKAFHDRRVELDTHHGDGKAGSSE